MEKVVWEMWAEWLYVRLVIVVKQNEVTCASMLPSKRVKSLLICILNPLNDVVFEDVWYQELLSDFVFLSFIKKYKIKLSF